MNMNMNIYMNTNMHRHDGSNYEDEEHIFVEDARLIR